MSMRAHFLAKVCYKKIEVTHNHGGLIMNYLLFSTCILFISIHMWWVTNTCTFCRVRLSMSDRLTNGRVRYRKKNTQLPVCRSCARINSQDVE